MASFTQDKRPLRVRTGLGADALLLERFSGEEGVSTPFHFVLDMLSENAAVDPTARVSERPDRRAPLRSRLSRRPEGFEHRREIEVQAGVSAA